MGDPKEGKVALTSVSDPPLNAPSRGSLGFTLYGSSFFPIFICLKFSDNQSGIIEISVFGAAMLSTGVKRDLELRLEPFLEKTNSDQRFT